MLADGKAATLCASPCAFGLASMQAPGAAGASDADTAALAQQLWSMTFRERMHLCCNLFCKTEPVQKRLNECKGERNRPDGFALDIE